MDTFWTFEQSLYIVDLMFIVHPKFVCLLVELHINACITYQMIKIVMIEQALLQEASRTYILPFPLHLTDGVTSGFIFLSQMMVWNFKTSGRLVCTHADSNTI